MKKKLLALCVALVLLVCMVSLVACGGKDSASSSSSGGISSGGGSKSSGGANTQKEPLVVRMLYPDNSSYPMQDGWLILEEIAKANPTVQFELITAPDNSADFETKRQLIFNSGDIPEIVATKGEISSEDIINGLLLPIDKYLHLLPNFAEFTEKYNYADALDNLREADGHYYALPTKANTSRIKIHTWLARVDIFEKHGIPLPETLDDVYEAGVKLKELYPDSYPIINRFGSGNVMGLLGSGFGTRAGWPLPSNGYIYDEDTNSWVFAPASPEFKELLVYMKKLLDNGVLDPEFISLDSAAYEQQVTQGKTFILIDWVGNQVRYNLEGTKANPDFNVQPIFPVVGPRGDFAMEPGNLYDSLTVLPATLAEHPRFEEIMAFIDWFYSEEGSIITTFGVEDVSYVVDDEGRLVYKDLTKEPSMTYGVHNNALTFRKHEDHFYAQNGAEISALFKEISEANAVPSHYPKVRYNEDEIEELKFLTPPVSDYFNSMIERFIYGKESFDNWDAYVKECERKGSLEIGEVINGAWARQQ